MQAQRVAAKGEFVDRETANKPSLRPAWDHGYWVADI
jgi:hypothetical protein